MRNDSETKLPLSKSQPDIAEIDNTIFHDAHENAQAPRNRTTPLPRLQMTVISFAIVCEPIVTSVVFPFIYPMVNLTNRK
jgi:hypothetical protein